MSTTVVLDVDNERRVRARMHTGVRVTSTNGRKTPAWRNPRTTMLLALVALSRCVCEDDLDELFPDIVVTPESVDLGIVALTAETPAVLQVGNVGQATLNVGTVRIETLDDDGTAFVDRTGAAFTVISAPSAVAPDEVGDLTLGFVPVSEGRYGAVIVIPSDDPDTAEVRVPIVGEGGAARIAADPPELDFGVVSEGPGGQRVISLVNIGLGTLNVSDIELESATLGTSSVFSLADGVVTARTIAVSGASTVDVFCNPTTEAWLDGGMLPFADALLVTSNASNAPVLRVPITADINRRPTVIAKELITRLTEVKVSIGREVTVDGTESSDPEGEALAFTWSIVESPDPAAILVSDPPGATCVDDTVCEIAEGYRCTLGPPQRCRQVAWTHITPQLAGTYVVKLRATDVRGAWGEALVTILPRDLVILLRWEPMPGSTCTQFTEAECEALPEDERFCPCGQSDLDLHFVRPLTENDPASGLGDYGVCPVACEETVVVDGTSTVVNYCYEDSDTHVDACRQTGADCAFANRFPEWGGVGRVDDPRLDVDDVRGFGPEAITLNSPADGTYFAAVHYCNDRLSDEPSVATVEVYVKGALVLSAGPQLLAEGDVWYAAQLSRAGGPDQGLWDIAELAPVTTNVGTDLCNY
jgi:hypothetical protein